MGKEFIKRFSYGLVVSLIFSLVSKAQGGEIEMADQMRANGKIYVVLITVLIVLVGLFLFLVYLERKISKLEK
jgi:hypothetical protein